MLHGMRTGESAERGEDHQLVVHKETGDLRLRPVEVGERDSGMNMTTNDAGMFHFARFMAECNRAFAHGTIQAGHVPYIARVTRMTIVIAADDFDGKRCMTIAPVSDGLQRGILTSRFPMKKIAQHQQPFRRVSCDQS